MNEKVKEKLRTPTGFRIVGEEAAYLSLGSGGPHMCMEIDDFTSLSTGKFNMAVYVRTPLCSAAPRARNHMLGIAGHRAGGVQSTPVRGLWTGHQGTAGRMSAAG